MNKDIKRLDLNTPDGAQLNMDALYQIAPSVFTESRDEKTGELKRVVNFDALRQLLGDNAVDESSETYEFRWVGKDAARAEAARAIDKTLRPVVEDSVDWDTTKNLYIEGDNLEVLKLLQRSYMGKVKMIYIDPPYNTGNDFVYHDDFAHSQAEEDLFAGNVDELGNRFIKNTNSNGRYHSDWCSMIYSRLMVARSLLTEDGVIFISIDDNEQRNLKNIADEIFGETNFIANLIWKSKSGGANDSKNIAVDHEYVLIFAKDASKLSAFMDRNSTVSTVYNLKDEKGEYSLDRLDKQSLGYIESLDFPIVGPDGKIYIVEHKNPDIKVARWRWSKETVEQRYSELVFKNGYVYTKNYKKEANIARSLLIEDRFGRTRTGKTDFTALFEAAYFSSPKPIKLIQHLIDIVESDEMTILDFFSGSATTAHAVMQLNAEEGGNRKFIMIQLPEETTEDSEAYKAGYNNICEIGKERIRRAGKKIKEEHPEVADTLDTGFRVLRLDDSNFNPGVKASPSEYNQQQLDLFANNIKAERNDLDLLFGSILAWGLQLDLPMQTEEVDGCKIYTVNEGDLVACFAEKVTDKVIEAMAEKEPLRVLFRDSCFDSDDKKINLFETFKQKLDWTDDEAFNNIRVI